MKAFSIPVLGAVIHSDKTREILKLHATDRGKSGGQSAFIRDAIMHFAKNKDFNFNFNLSEINNNVRPGYIPENVWLRIKKAQQTSYSVEYTYAIAIYFLLSLPRFTGYSMGKLVREIIESTNHHQ